jgi:molybdopterin biosynthesis enzyme
MFVRPLILFLLKAEDTRPKILEAKLEAPAKCDPQRASLVPALVRFESGGYRIRTAPWKGSSDLVGLARANALIMIPCREGTLEAGESAQFLLME